MVSAAVFIAIIFSFFFSIVIFIIPAIILYRKYHTSWKVFFIGCGIWFLFAMVLEQIMHALVLATPAGDFLRNTIWAMALYGGLAAGIFEETGRLIAMRFWLKKNYGNERNALMYGAGHGGFEALFLLAATMVNNLIYSIMINTGQIEQTLASLPADARPAMDAAVESLITATPGLFLLGDVERISAVILHIALSVLVWMAVVHGKKVLFPLAIACHAAVDAVTVLLADMLEQNWILEIVVFVMALLVMALAWKLWKKYVPEPIQETEVKEEFPNEI